VEKTDAEEGERGR